MVARITLTVTFSGADIEISIAQCQGNAPP